MTTTPDDDPFGLFTDPEAPRPDGRAAARAASAPPPRPRRFWTEAGHRQEPDGRHVLVLDGRPARTPARHPLSLPTRAAAEAVAAEWQAVGAEIDPTAMPMTRLVNSALDGVARM